MYACARIVKNGWERKEGKEMIRGKKG